MLKFYPRIWRIRYGAEFVDFMEQSIADTPHDAKRTLNIIFKSSKARLSELGIAGPTLDSTEASKAALSTSIVLATVFSVFALFYWSTAMVSWNSNPHVVTPWSVSIWTGAITVSAMAIALALFAIGVIVISHAVKLLVSKQDKRFALPLIVGFVSAVVIVNAVHQFTRLTIARGGIQWFQFGVGLKQVAGATQWVTQSIIWGPSWTGGSTFGQGLLHISATIAVVVLALGVAKIIRLSEFTFAANQAGVKATRFLSLSMVLFLFSCLGWEISGGSTNSWMAPFTAMEKSLFFVIALIAGLCVTTSFGTRNSRTSIQDVIRSDEP
jgi:hypothetical protein